MLNAQVGSVDQWVWHLHSSMCYYIRSAYNKLTEMDINDYQDAYNFVWLKEVPLKAFIFSWRLILNRVPTRDNLWKRHILVANE